MSHETTLIYDSPAGALEPYETIASLQRDGVTAMRPLRPFGRLRSDIRSAHPMSVMCGAKVGGNGTALWGIDIRG